MALAKLQGADFKSESDLIAQGGSAADLLRDTKIYVSALSINKTLDDAITDGDLNSVPNGSITNAKLADVATQTFKGRTTAGTGSPEDLTATQATALLNNVVGDSGSGGTKGLVPAPAAGDAAASKFLKADGTWATPGSSARGTWTPTITGCGTVSSVNFSYIVIGDLMFINGSFVSGTTTANPTTFSLPLTAEVGPTLAANSLVGGGTRDNAAGGVYSVIAALAADTTLGIGAMSGSNGLAIQNGNSILTSGDTVSVWATLEVAGL
jgi:hypothetical protein